MPLTDPPPDHLTYGDRGAAAVLQAQLGPDEHVIWDAYPDRHQYYDRKAAVSGRHSWAWQQVRWARLTGAVKAAREPRSLYYAVTTSRAVILTTGPKPRLRSFSPSDLRDIHITGSTGDVLRDVLFGPGRFWAVTRGSIAYYSLRELKNKGRVSSR